MVSPNVDKIFQETQALNDAEREELRSLLTLRASRNQERAKQDQVRQALVKRGLLEKEPPRGKDSERYARWQPIPIKGKPLSEAIIEERR
jgi:hypothetical protein